MTFHFDGVAMNIARAVKDANLTIDPEIQALIPPLSEEEAAQLEANLKAEGCREPLVASSGRRVLLDGHHRKLYCDRHGIGYRIVEVEVPSREAAKAWVIRNQFGRRNLTDYQRGELTEKLKEVIAAESERREKAGKKLQDVSADPTPNLGEGRHDRETNAQLAAVAGISRNTLAKVEKIGATADESVKEMARKGDVSIDAAAKVAELPKAEQRKVAAKGPKAVKAKAAEVRKAKAPAALAPNDPPEADPIITDLEGHVITDPKVAEAFRNADAFDEILSLLRQVASKANPLRGDIATKKKPIAGGEMFSVGSQAWNHDLKELRNAIHFGRPHALCPYPHHGSKPCDACKGLGWLTVRGWKDAPEDFRARLGKRKEQAA